MSVVCFSPSRAILEDSCSASSLPFIVFFLTPSGKLGDSLPRAPPNTLSESVPIFYTNLGGSSLVARLQSDDLPDLPSRNKILRFFLFWGHFYTLTLLPSNDRVFSIFWSIRFFFEAPPPLGDCYRHYLLLFFVKNCLMRAFFVRRSVLVGGYDDLSIPARSLTSRRLILIS